MATEGRRKVCVAPFMRDRDLGGESVVRACRQGQNHKSRKLAKLSVEKNGDEENDAKRRTVPFSTGSPISSPRRVVGVASSGGSKTRREWRRHYEVRSLAEGEIRFSEEVKGVRRRRARYKIGFDFSQPWRRWLTVGRIARGLEVVMKELGGISRATSKQMKTEGGQKQVEDRGLTRGV